MNQPKGPGGKPSKAPHKESGKRRDNKPPKPKISLRMFSCLISSLMLVVPAQASDFYEVQVTRKSQDLYEVLHKGMYIKTQFCYEYVYYDDAILRIDSQYGYTIGEIVFNNGSKCDVKKILN